MWRLVTSIMKLLKIENVSYINPSIVGDFLLVVCSC